MLGLGAWELAMVMVVALVVLGPDKIPEVARRLARFLGQARRMADDVRRNVDEALAEVQPPAVPPAGAFTEWLERQQARDHAAPDGTFAAPASDAASTLQETPPAGPVAEATTTTPPVASASPPNVAPASTPEGLPGAPSPSSASLPDRSDAAGRTAGNGDGGAP